jgi:hypothetical protein
MRTELSAPPPLPHVRQAGLHALPRRETVQVGGMNLLYGIHDQASHPLIPVGGWIVESIALNENPQPQNWTQISPDINWILRLNWAHNGRDGTIPLRGQYDEFAKRCADYLGRTKGVNVVVIANEPNHRQEYPSGTPISPEDYADCFNRCYKAITYERPDVEVMTAAVAPWDITSGMDWLAYYKRMLGSIYDCDGLAVHGYTHGADPDLIWSAEKVQGWYWHFPVIYQTIQAIPPRFATLPVHVTETDQGDNAWMNVNSSWVQNAYRSVDEHNRTPGTQKIFSLTLYRWRGDKYAIHDKNGVQDDFKAAAAHGYPSPAERPDVPPQPTPTPPNPHPPTPAPEPEPERDIDPRLIARGVHVEPEIVPAGTGYWRAQRLVWLDRAAEQIGPDHHILGETTRDGRIAADVPLLVVWPSGSTTVVSKRVSYNDAYNYDFSMGPSLNEYSICVHDGSPSDVVSGIGMGKDGNPREHTSTLIDWQWTISEGITPPILPPTPPQAERLIWPVVGPVTQRWGENPDFYQRTLGIPYHNGVDIGVPVGTKVVASADGIVKWVDDDPTGYGVYCRIYLPAVRFHIVTAHLDRVVVQVGDEVKQGQVIAYSGNSGLSSGPHTHIETRAGTEHTYAQGTFGNSNGRVDPQAVFWALGGTQEPMAGPGR